MKQQLLRGDDAAIDRQYKADLKKDKKIGYIAVGGLVVGAVAGGYASSKIMKRPDVFSVLLGISAGAIAGMFGAGYLANKKMMA